MSLCPPTNPISSNQVCEVGILKPKCATFSGNTLNDWLKWLAENECEVSWADLDLTCITDLLGTCECEQTKKYVIETMLAGICKALEIQSECCSGTVMEINLESDWVASRTPYATRKGNVVTLSGRVTSGNYNGIIGYLPQDAWPDSLIVTPVAHEIAPSASYIIFLQIGTDGSLRLFFNGSTPADGSSRAVYFDGINYTKKTLNN